MSCIPNISDLGRLPYEEALSLQRKTHQTVVDGRNSPIPSPVHLLLLEHDPAVITMSKRPTAGKHLLATPDQLKSAGVEICRTDRGGDITYHGPGQLVGYPICDLNVLSLRIHGYMRFLEQCIIDVLAEFNITAARDACATGVWVEGSKICAMGVRVSKWVSMHGFALNVTTNLDHFDLIVPCGLAGRSVTSMQQILGEACPPIESVKGVVSEIFAEAIATQAQVQREPRQ